MLWSTLDFEMLIALLLSGGWNVPSPFSVRSSFRSYCPRMHQWLLHNPVGFSDFLTVSYRTSCQSTGANEIICRCVNLLIVRFPFNKKSLFLFQKRPYVSHWFANASNLLTAAFSGRLIIRGPSEIFILWSGRVESGSHEESRSCASSNWAGPTSDVGPWRNHIVDVMS